MIGESRYIFWGAIPLILILLAVLPASGADDVSVTPVTTPFITIDPIGNHVIGDIIFVNGTTNLRISTDQKLQLAITPFSYSPRGLALNLWNPQIISVSDGIAHWSFNVTDLHWGTEEYVATAFSSAIPNIYSDQHFWIFSAPTTVTPSLIQDQPSAQIPSEFPSSYPVIGTTTRPASPFPEILPVFAIWIGIFFYSYLRQ